MQIANCSNVHVLPIRTYGLLYLCNSLTKYRRDLLTLGSVVTLYSSQITSSDVTSLLLLLLVRFLDAVFRSDVSYVYQQQRVSTTLYQRTISHWCYAALTRGRVKCFTPSVCPSRASDFLEIGKP